MNYSKKANKQQIKSDVAAKVQLTKELFYLAGKVDSQRTYITGPFADKIFDRYQDISFLNNDRPDNFYHTMPTTIEKRFLMLQKSPYTYFRGKNYKEALQKLGIPEKEPLLHNFSLNPIHRDFIDVLIDEFEDEDRDTNSFKFILMHLRSLSDSFTAGMIYTKIRNFIPNHRKGFTSKEQAADEMRNLGITSMYAEALLSSLEEITGRDLYHCYQCGRPISLSKQNNLDCVHYRCKSENGKNVSRLEKVKDNKFFWNAAYYRSVVIPSFLEREIATIIGNRFPEANIIPFPNIERDGDLLVTISGTSFKIDAKDYRHKEHLISYLKSERGKNIPNNSIIVTNNEIIGNLKDKELAQRGIEIVRLRELVDLLHKKLQVEFDF